MKNYAHQIDPPGCSGKGVFPHDVGLKKHDVYDLKLDGIRYLYQIRPNGASDNFLTSRHVSVKTGRFVEKQDVETKMRDWKWPANLNGLVFDGEVCGGSLSSDTQHAMTSGDTKYVCWGIIRDRDGSGLTEAGSWQMLCKVLRGEIPPWFTLVPRFETVAGAVKRVGDDGEGLIGKMLNVPYGEKWTKYKRVETHDCFVTGFLPSQSAIYQAKGWIGAIRLGQYDSDGAITDVGTCDGFTQGVRAEISANPKKFLNQCVEIKCQQRLASGKFRHGKFLRWRHDKNAKQCVFLPEKHG